MDRGRQQVDHIHGHNPHFKKNTDLDHATGITDLKSDRQQKGRREKVVYTTTGAKNCTIPYLKDVLDEVDGDDGGQVPVQLGQDQHLALLHKEIHRVNKISLFCKQVCLQVNKVSFLRTLQIDRPADQSTN